MKKCRYKRCRNQCQGEYCSPNCAALDASENGISRDHWPHPNPHNDLKRL